MFVIYLTVVQLQVYSKLSIYTQLFRSLYNILYFFS